jgi:hypothetical protein
MIDDLEPRTLMSATLASADPDEGGEIAVIVYSSRTTTTSADLDEGGEADPDEGGEIAARKTRTPSSFVITKTYDKSSPVFFKL